MAWFTMTDHLGRPVEINSTEDMQKVVDDFERRLDRVAEGRESADRTVRRSAAQSFEVLMSYREQLVAEVARANEHAEREDHARLAKAIRERNRA